MSTQAEAQFAELCKLQYRDQAIWFLNGFWEAGIHEEAEKVWEITAKFMELDSKREKGNELDEFNSHRLLEVFDETLTVIKMREALREIDVDSNNYMSLIEYLIYRYKKGVEEAANAPQGDNSQQVDEAQAALEAVQAAVNEVQQQLAEVQTQKENVKAKLEAQQQALAETEQKLEEQRAAEAAVKEAEAELEAAVAELKAQEDAYAARMTELEGKSQDQSLGVVTRNKAAAELAQMKSEDPMPLRRAKITQEAALRKVQKQRKAAEAATAAVEEMKRQCEVALQELETAKADLENAEKELEAKVEELMRSLDEAKQQLDEAKKTGGTAHGQLWWIERELLEAEKYLPQSKQTRLRAAQ